MEQPAVETVPCRICQKPVIRGPGKLTGHISAHKRTATKRWNVKEYIKAFGPDSADDFIHGQPNLQQIKINTERLLAHRREDGTIAPTPDDEKSTMERLRSQLSTGERKEFDEQYEIIFQKIDRDEVQSPRVAQYVFSVIQLNRLVIKQMQPAMTGRAKNDDDLEKLIKSTETRIKGLAESLGISREQQLKNRQNIKTSVASLISGYFNEIERNPTEMLQAWKLEEEKALKVNDDRINQYYVSVAPDLKEDEHAEADYVPDLEEIIRHSAVTF